MSKPKSPLFSLGAHGTIGDSLTYQERSGVDFVRQKPIPTDRYTLAQAYHRWDYQWYALQWHALSAAEKLAYRKLGSTCGITGFNYYMKVALNTLPDLVARWHLDEAAGTVAYDSSKSGYNGDIFGALHVPGVISNALWFDNLDDYINCGVCPLLNFTDEDFTIIAWLKPYGALSGAICSQMNAIYTGGYILGHSSGVKTYLRQADNIGYSDTIGGALTIDSWNHLAVVRQMGHVGRVYINGVDTTTSPSTKAMTLTTRRFEIADWSLGAGWEFPGSIDELAIFNRALSQEEVQILYERSYP